MVSGKVTDTKKFPIDGVGMLIKGSKKAVTTNAQGTFTLTNVPENAILVFSFTGYVTKEYQINGSTSINISLVDQTSGLNEVVVVGYGTRTKKDLTCAVSQVKATQLENENPKTGKSFNGKTYSLSNFSTSNFMVDRVLDKNIFYKTNFITVHGDQYRMSQYHVLWPIPQNAILANADGHINQNIGYSGAATNVPASDKIID